METRILDFDSGVEMWKVTPSKSETVWSMETGGALWHLISYTTTTLTAQQHTLRSAQSGQTGSKHFGSREATYCAWSKVDVCADSSRTDSSTLGKIDR